MIVLKGIIVKLYYKNVKLYLKRKNLWKCHCIERWHFVFESKNGGNNRWQNYLFL